MPTSALLRLALVVMGCLCAASLVIGINWLHADRQQVRSVALLGSLEGLQLTPLSAPAVPLLVNLSQLLPQLESLGVDPTPLQEPLTELTAKHTQAKITDRVALSQEIKLLRRQLQQQVQILGVVNQSRIKQILSLLAVVLLLAVLIFGLSVRPRSTSVATRLLDADSHDLQYERTLFGEVPVPLLWSDEEQRIIAVNAAYERFSGYDAQECVGQHVDFNLSGQQNSAHFEAMADALEKFDRWQGELWLRHKNGEAFSEKVTRVTLRDPASRTRGHLTISQDGAAGDASNRLMLWQAHHDSLTKLPNRNLLEDRLNRALLNTGRSGALISIDLDKFKDLNDSIGPVKGDQILTETAFRLAICAQESDTVARLGADQFALITEDVVDEREIERVAHAIVSACREPFIIENRQLYASASVGVVMYPRDGDSVGELLQKAHAACAQVKRAGGDNVGFFEPEINTRAERRLEIETQLRDAIASNQLSLHLQPILDVDKHEVIGAEALLRWQHPELGFVSPAEFIPVAEASRLIVSVGEWVLEEAGRIQQIFEQQTLSDLRVSLNVSAAQIRQPSDVARLLAVVDELDTAQITIELTESAIIDDAEGASGFLQALSSRGCRVALDDFGTGFSSLGYLRDFNFDLLKIDKTFIDSLDVERDRGLVASIVSMGKIMGMKIVAEGVETAVQLGQLEQMGCDYVQGYHYSKPLPVPEFIEFVRNERAQGERPSTALASTPQHG